MCVWGGGGGSFLFTRLSFGLYIIWSDCDHVMIVISAVLFQVMTPVFQCKFVSSLSLGLLSDYSRPWLTLLVI